MSLDPKRTQEDLVRQVEIAASGVTTAEQEMRLLARRIIVDTWHCVALGQYDRPTEWLDLLRRVLLVCHTTPPGSNGVLVAQIGLILAELEDSLGMAAASMPRSLPASAGPRDDLELLLLKTLDGTFPGHVGKEYGRWATNNVHTCVIVTRGFERCSREEIGRVLAILADRGLVVRADGLWQISPRLDRRAIRALGLNTTLYPYEPPP